METLILEEENIAEDIGNLIRLKKEENYTAVKDMRNLFGQEKETKAIKNRILIDIKNLFIFFGMKKKKKIIINQYE